LGARQGGLCQLTQLGAGWFDAWFHRLWFGGRFVTQVHPTINPRVVNATRLMSSQFGITFVLFVL